jgi:RNA polymerase sigma factor (sigma-70 family)
MTEKLLQEYVGTGSESAFRELVERYVNLVYSTAYRRLAGDAHLAEDAVQTVFSDFARKAPTLPENVMLGGWLHRHTCFVTGAMLRSSRRRQTREREAMELFDSSTDDNWKTVAPVLDEVVNQLAPADRDAVILRFFEGLDFRTIGARIGSNEDAAQKRVSRALEKLRVLLEQRGATFSIAGLATLLGQSSSPLRPVLLRASPLRLCRRLQPASDCWRPCSRFLLPLNWLSSQRLLRCSVSLSGNAVPARRAKNRLSSAPCPLIWPRAK